MLLTTKQTAIFNLINKSNKIIITPQSLYLQQKARKIFTNKAISQHLQNFTRMGVLIRVKHGSYMLAKTIKETALQVSTALKPIQAPKIKETISLQKKETLPSFLSHEDIEKLIEWKTTSITQTTEKITNLQLKINKLKGQQTTLFGIKKQFC
jgi:hypothetical protein